MKGPRHLLQRYHHLHHRSVDLVGDFAGCETFILEGDSLLLHLFSDPKLDFAEGLQLLHAVYLVERFLQDLKRRKCNFALVFFDCHQNLCAPYDTSTRILPKYLLAREVVIQHLQRNTPAEVSVAVRRFDSFQSGAFDSFLVSSGTYFIMCHDGSSPRAAARSPLRAHGNPDFRSSIHQQARVVKRAKPELEISDSTAQCDSNNIDDDDSTSYDGVNGSSEDGNILHENAAHTALQNTAVDCSTLGSSKPGDDPKLFLRPMILWFIARGYNVALLNGIEFQDSKVMAMVVESRSGTVPDINQPDPVSTAPETSASDGVERLPQTKHSFEVRGRHLSQREILTVYALAQMNSDGCSPIGPAHVFARALAIQCASLAGVPMSCRAVDVPNMESHQCDHRLILETVRAAHSILRSRLWEQVAGKKEIDCDLADFIDGRYLLATLATLRCQGTVALPTESLERLKSLALFARELCGMDLDILSCVKSEWIDQEKMAAVSGTAAESAKHSSTSGGVLPFSNPVFDVHLAPVRVDVDASKEEPSPATAKTFVELTHWHNHKVSLERRKQRPLTKYQLMKGQRRRQQHMTEMRDYASSLTNASGGMLQPETILTVSGKRQYKASPAGGVPSGGTAATASERPKPGGPAARPQRKAPAKVKGGKAAAMESADALSRQKQARTVDAAFHGWTKFHGSMNIGRDGAAAVYKATERFLLGLPGDKRTAVEPEVLCYMLHTLLLLWKSQIKARPLHIAALAWHTIKRTQKLKAGVSINIEKRVKDTIAALGLPPVELNVRDKRQISFDFTIQLKQADLSIGLSHLEFQLAHAGPYLDRSMGSAPDPRVSGFEPDEWQREVLDQIDQNRSFLVVAPTSAGKTFISFYAMKKVLGEDDDGVLVYVAPTKALVNQIAAEVQARFSKLYKHEGKSVWAIHTRDHRINNPTGCQVLITVPHILQIMLLAPSNAGPWSEQIKWIIFDEVHCIGQAEDGLIWEQLLLMAPCPIIALSATIGNPEAFSSWLRSTQEALGVELTMIKHQHRHSDLRKFLYSPPKSFDFRGLPPLEYSLDLGLDDVPGFAFIHPFSCLHSHARRIPTDLSLEPRDCWTLWQAMGRHQTESYPVGDFLDPFQILPPVVRKVDVFVWQERLRSVFESWMRDPESPFQHVLADLEKMTKRAKQPESQVSDGPIEPQPREVRDDILHTTLPLICSLHSRDALPALFFNYDREYCERIAQSLLERLVEAEERYKSGPEWRAKIARWRSWEKAEAKAKVNRARNAPSKPSKKRRGSGEAEEGPQIVAEEEASPWASFDADEPIDGFHLAGENMSASRSVLQGYEPQLKQRGVVPWLIEALRRGIGVHHAGMNRKYRQVCEILFRKGYLRVVIATGTLALGINMPCKTVVFSGDSIYLTALNFRQAAGRAGRRGFDLLGNIVFQHVPYRSVCRLLTSRLPELRGHFPLTTSLVLRMGTLLHGSKCSQYAIRAVNSILSVPRIYLDGAESKATVLHHLRFSIEYLRRNHLFGPDGSPLNFAGLVSHMYYAENSAFAFHALLKDGYFHHLCADIDVAPQRTLRTLMLVMSHLFGRRKLPQSTIEWYMENKKRSSSVVVLPPLPDEAENILQGHNEATLDIFASYVRTFAEEHIRKPDNQLPFTHKTFGGTVHEKEAFNGQTLPVVSHLQPTEITSTFVALSGHRDRWSSIEELCRSVRSGIWLEEAVVPHIRIGRGEMLNAYLYDFFSHGSMNALEKGNRIRRGDIWYLLNDFSLVLALIVTSLNNYLLPSSPDLETGGIDIQGRGDTYVEAEDMGLADLDAPGPAAPQQTHQKRASAKSAVVRENWEDDLEVEDTDSDSKEEDPNDTGAFRATIHRRSVEGEIIGSSVGEGFGGGGMMHVLKAFTLLQKEFDDKYWAIGA